jgi:hypothetical protein
MAYQPNSSFQYPLTDRGGCNLRDEYGVTAIVTVSVSTNGSRRVQRNLDLVHKQLIRRFTGSRRVQLQTLFYLAAMNQMFQYPLTDRGGCNFKMYFENSVSTNGSRRVQL